MSNLETIIKRQMAAKTVNLDALIPREDFLSEVGPSTGAEGTTDVSATALRAGESFYASLRKPDFQRETAAWSPQQVLALVKAFIEGDLVPSVICWQSPARLSFAIDGAHRLSAVIAWIMNDYGAGDLSIKFYNNQISEEQRKIAKRTEDLINKEVGSYKDIMEETRNPGSNPRLSEHALALAHSKFHLQWITNKDPKKAEQAFFTINQSAVKIDATELKILDTRFKSNSVIARAVVRNATGHKYWGKFSEDSAQKIENDARAINELLFTPPLNSKIKTIDLPIAGHGYGSQALPLIYELVNLANGIPVEDPARHKTKRAANAKKGDADKAEPLPPNENNTTKAIKNTLRLTKSMTGMHPSSLGLHPAVYFYSASGRHQPTAVLSISAIVKDLDQNNKFNAFCEVRSELEEFLLNHKDLVNQITRKTGSMAKGYKLLKEYFEFIIEQLKAGNSESAIEKNLTESEKFSFLQISAPITSSQSKAFSGAAKHHAFLEEALEAAIVCKICGARKEAKSMTADHTKELRMGGLADTSNLQYVHPYCNSAYKDHKDKHGATTASPSAEPNKIL